MNDDYGDGISEREYYDMMEDAESDFYGDAEYYEDSDMYTDYLHKEFLRQNPWYKD